MRAASKILRSYQLSKPEIILRSLPRNADNNVFIEKYNKFLTSLKDDSFIANDMRLTFRNHNFYRFSNNEMKRLVVDSFKIYKEKNVLNTAMYYNIYMRNCIGNMIDFNVMEVIQEMNSKNIPFNQGTYEILIEVLCDRGEMSAVENLLGAMKSADIILSNTVKFGIISGYIAAGQPEKSLAFIKENNLNENSIGVLTHQGNGYASIGDVDNVLNIIKKLQENLPPEMKCVFDFYFRLVKSNNVSDSNLQQIFDLLYVGKTKDILNDTIFRLNRCGFYNHSLKLVDKFVKELKNGPRSRVVDLIMSYKSSDCPINTYKKVLKVLLKFLHPDLHNNLFSNMNFDDAFMFAQAEFTEQSGKIIFTCLLNKAIDDKSKDNISSTLLFGLDRLPRNIFNMVLNYGYIPSLLRSGLVSNCNEIIKFIPQLQYLILPAVLTYHLSKRNLTEYNSLLSEYSVIRPIYYSMVWKPVATEILCNYSFTEMNRFVAEASKALDTVVINNLLGIIIIEKIILSSNAGETGGIQDGVKLAEDFNVTFLPSKIELLKNIAKKDIEHFKPLFERINESKTERAIQDESSATR